MVFKQAIRIVCIATFLVNSLGSALLLNRSRYSTIMYIQTCPDPPLEPLCHLKYEDAIIMRGSPHTSYSSVPYNIYKTSTITAKSHEPVQKLKFERDRDELRDGRKPRASCVLDCLKSCLEQRAKLALSSLRSRSPIKTADESSGNKCSSIWSACWYTDFK